MKDRGMLLVCALLAGSIVVADAQLPHALRIGRQPGTIPDPVPTPDTTPPTVTINTPTTSASWDNDQSTTLTIAGTLADTQSNIAAVTWDNHGTITPWDPYLSIVGDTKVCVGVLTVATGASTTFTPGTTDLDAAGITDTYIDGIDQSLLPLIAGGDGTIAGLS